MINEPTEHTAGQPPATTTELTFAALNPPATSTTAGPSVSLAVLLHIAAVREHVAELLTQVPHHGVSLDDMQFSADGRSVTLLAWSVRELDAWYQASGGGASLTVSSRQRVEGSRSFGRGGLDWTLGLGRIPGRLDTWLSVMTETVEDEVLPDLLVVRAAGRIAGPFVVTAGSAVAA